MGFFVLWTKFQDAREQVQTLEIQNALLKEKFYEMKDKCQELLDTCEKWPEEEQD